MIDIKKIRILTSIISLVVMVVLAIIVVRFSRVQETGFQPIKWEPSREQLIRKPPKVDKRPERKLVLPEARKKPSLPVSINTKAEQPPQPQEKDTLEEDELLRENITDMLAWAMEEDFPELNLSESEFRGLTETVMTIRATMQGLRGTEGNHEDAEAFIKKRDQMAQATTDFKRMTGMNLVEFLLRASTQGGIDNDEPDHEEIVLEYIDNSGQ